MPTTYDVLDDGLAGGTAFVGPTAVCSAVYSYSRAGSDHFLAVNESGSLAVWHYTGGTRTGYTIGTIGPGIGQINFGSEFGDVPIRLRSDGTHTWLGYLLLAHKTQTFSGHTISWNSWELTVAVWNGSGFTVIGQDGSGYQNSSADGAFDVGYIGQLTAAACSAESGVCHFAWSESGAHKTTATTGQSPTAQRLSYVKCSTSAITTQMDLLSGSDGPTGYTGSFTTPIVTQYARLTNGRGSPLLFYAAPTAMDTSAVASAGAIVSYPTTIEMIDVDASSAGSPSVLRTINGTSFDATTLGLAGSSATAADQSTTIGSSRFPTSPFGTELVYLHVPWTRSDGTEEPILISGKADGSAAFTFPDGSSTETPPATVISPDVIDDTRNIWVGLSRSAGGGLSQFHRDCPAWASWAHAFSACDRFVSGIEFEEVTDTLYTAGRDATDHTKFGVVAIPILRNYATCGTGLRAWQRFS